MKHDYSSFSTSFRYTRNFKYQNAIQQQAALHSAFAWLMEGVSKSQSGCLPHGICSKSWARGALLAETPPRSLGIQMPDQFLLQVEGEPVVRGSGSLNFHRPKHLGCVLGVDQKKPKIL